MLRLLIVVILYSIVGLINMTHAWNDSKVWILMEFHRSSSITYHIGLIIGTIFGLAFVFILWPLSIIINLLVSNNSN